MTLKPSEYYKLYELQFSFLIGSISFLKIQCEAQEMKLIPELSRVVSWTEIWGDETAVSKVFIIWSCRGSKYYFCVLLFVWKCYFKKPYFLHKGGFPSRIGSSVNSKNLHAASLVASHSTHVFVCVYMCLCWVTVSIFHVLFVASLACICTTMHLAMRTLIKHIDTGTQR